MVWSNIRDGLPREIGKTIQTSWISLPIVLAAHPQELSKKINNERENADEEADIHSE